jgi:predicted O-methyltransferase YrrM
MIALVKLERELKVLREYAEGKYIPIIKGDTSNLLEILIKIHKPDTVLEIGTAIGFSATLIAMHTGGLSKIDTIERDYNMVYEARQNFDRFDITNIISVIPGEASDILPCLSDSGKKYDFIFLDAAKGQYNEFFPYCFQMLNIGGLLVSDNIYFHGLVKNKADIPRKHITAVRALKQYIEMLKDNNELTTAFLDVGDGVAVSLKK